MTISRRINATVINNHHVANSGSKSANVTCPLAVACTGVPGTGGDINSRMAFFNTPVGDTPLTQLVCASYARATHPEKGAQARLREHSAYPDQRAACFAPIGLLFQVSFKDCAHRVWRQAHVTCQYRTQFLLSDLHARYHLRLFIHAGNVGVQALIFLFKRLRGVFPMCGSPEKKQTDKYHTQRKGQSQSLSPIACDNRA